MAGAKMARVAVMSRMSAALIPANESADWANRFPRERRIAAKMFADTTTHLPHQSHRTTNHPAVLDQNRRHHIHRPRRRVTGDLQAQNRPARDHHHEGESLQIAGSIVFGGLALLAGSRAWADSAEAIALFAEAKTAFEAEDFSKAHALFDRARAEGMQGPVIHYNIGAAAFRGGDLPRAERAFREVAEASNTPSMTALAHYNLGLVAMQTREEREARRWFERAIEESPDVRVVELASRRIAELPEPRAPALSYYSRGGFGYDDNVSLRSSSIEGPTTGVEDTYGELIVAGSYSLGGWRVDASGAMLEYINHDEFSQSVYSLGGARVFTLENWYFEVGASAAQLSLGGDVYERDTAASALASRMFFGGSRLRAQIRASRVDGKADFIGLTGDRTELGVFFDKSWRAWIFGVHARAEDNDSEDPVFASRWIQLGTEARYALSPAWGLMANAALRRIAHPAQSETLHSWNDNRATLQLGVTRALWKQTQLFVRLEHERNSSPVVGYDYDRNLVAASIETWR